MIDFFRKQKKSFKIDENADETNIKDDSFSEGDSIVKIQTQHFSESAGFVVSKLPEKYRIAVHLADIKGLSMKKVAARLGISVSGTKSRVQRGRKMIKEIILKCCEVNTDKYDNIIEYEPHICSSGNKC